MNGLRNKKLGVIGVGQMGALILEGILEKRLVPRSQVWVYDKIDSKKEAIARRLHVNRAASAEALLKAAEVVLLAIKPQDLSEFASQSRAFLRSGQCVLSIMAGMTIAKLEAALGKKLSIVRAMPNLGAKAGQSMTVLCGQDPQGISLAAQLFKGCGEVVSLPEKSLDLVTALSGSGPAYFFYVMELLERFGVRHGLPPQVSRLLAVQTGLGAARVAKGSNISCADLRKMVTSKKGTTEAALEIFKEGKLDFIFKRALTAAMKRSRALRGGA